jgi:hypothetical protein
MGHASVSDLATVPNFSRKAVAEIPSTVPCRRIIVRNAILSSTSPYDVSAFAYLVTSRNHVFPIKQIEWQNEFS